MLNKLFNPKNKNRIFMALSCSLIYTISFFLIERLNLNYNLIHTKLDDIIPFNEYFMIFYGYWFVYLFASVIYFILEADDESYKSFLLLLFGGMMVCLLIYLIYPNYVNLRPRSYSRDNIFIEIVKLMHKVDTPTNVNPSIHVYATLACLLATWKWTDRYRKRGWLLGLDCFLSLMIILSTVFLKQHSVLDIVGGTLMLVLYFPIEKYRRKLKKI